MSIVIALFFPNPFLMQFNSDFHYYPLFHYYPICICNGQLKRKLCNCIGYIPVALRKTNGQRDYVTEQGMASL